ncbi:retrovirus-related Pol polyprotein from transposon TNT 1-94 [Trichonephila clavipes]|nr:retrovirus-related Pol polyprotein from transposon TNT 1-94 [Trichonephila clavipes]
MEFCHTKFSKYLNELGIRCERTNTYTPEQNGVPKRFNLTAMDCVKAMLNTSGIQKCFGAEALVCFTYVKKEFAINLKIKPRMSFILAVSQLYQILREAILRQDDKRYDIYYRIKDVTLRSFNDVEKYCKDNDILYDKSLFDFNSTVNHNDNRPEASNINFPRHFKDAKNSPQSDKWQDAMKEEINVMKERDVWELVPAPQDSKVIRCRWAYTLKTDSKGKICKYTKLDWLHRGITNKRENLMMKHLVL